LPSQASLPTRRTPDASKRRLGPLEASLWMGTSTAAWWRMLHSHGGRVTPSQWLGAGVDGAFSLLHTMLRAAQHVPWHRAIARRTVPVDPVFILGHWRSGTTLMHELLALDPAFRAPTTYECFVPHHFLLSRRWITPWSRFVLPRSRPPDAMPVGWDRPQEDEFALCLRGAGSLYESIAFPRELQVPHPTLELDHLPPQQLDRWRTTWYRFLRELLCAREGRLLLKSPTHTFRWQQLAEWFPRARFILMVRHPFATYASTIKLWDSLFHQHSYQPWPANPLDGCLSLESFVVKLHQRLLDRIEPLLDTLPDNRLRVVPFESFTKDPLTTLAALYRSLDLGDFRQVRERIEADLARRSGYRTDTYQLDEPTRCILRNEWRFAFEAFRYNED